MKSSKSDLPEVPVKRCLELLNQITGANEAVPTNEIRQDLFAALSASFEKFIVSDQDLRHCFETSHDEDSCIKPSTSAVESDSPPDARIRFSQTMVVVYQMLSSALSLERRANPEADEYTFLSLKEISVVSSSLQMFFLTKCLPYIEEGVGAPVMKRSSFIKTWSRVSDDPPLQCKQLTQGLCVFRDLMESNDALRTEILGRYLPDIVCVFEQLKYSGGLSPTLSSSIEDHIATVPASMRVSTFLVLSKCVDSKCPPPRWFTLSIGNRLSCMLVGENGLRHTLDAYRDMGGEEFWQNSHLLSCLGRQLALPPSSKKKMSYYENMSGQFMSLIMSSTVHPTATVARMFSVFVDDMNKKEPLAGSVLVLDALFKPWENLCLRPKSVPLGEQFRRSLFLLSCWADEKICPHLVATSKRLVEITPMLLELSYCGTDGNAIPHNLDVVRKQLLNILKFTVRKISNKGEFLLCFISNTKKQMWQLKHNKKLVSVIGEDSLEEDNDISLTVAEYSDQEELVMARLDATLSFIKAIDAADSNRLLLELLCESVTRWAAKKNTVGDSPRFVDIDGADIDSEWARLSSHLVAVFCFEQLGEWDLDATDPAVSLALVNLVKTVLHSVRESFIEESRGTADFDVQSVPSEDVLRMRGMRTASAKMAVGLAAAIVAAANMTEQLSSSLTSMAAELREFRCFATESEDGELHQVAKDAIEVVKLLELVGLAGSDNVEAPQDSRTKPGLPTDVISDLRRDLNDPLEPVRGEALLRTARYIRRKDPRVTAVLDDWLYANIKELVGDPDSYVYLAAINALAEVACFDSNKYLKDLLLVFKQLAIPQTAEVTEPTTSSSTTPDDDSSLMLRGKLAEAIGKVFRVLGDISPAWLADAAHTFLSCLREKSDIVRASSLSALSDLILACRGRGLERYLDEILYAVDSLVRSDDSPLVRRAAVHLVRQVLRSCDSNVIEVVGSRLRDLHRSLVWLRKWDRDHVVRLHAELCLEELKAGLKNSLEGDLHNMMRIIPIK